MALKIYDTMKPQGDYPAVKAADVEMPDGTRLDTWKPQGNASEVEIFPLQEVSGFTLIDNGAYVAAKVGKLFEFTTGEEYRVSFDGSNHTVIARDVPATNGEVITGIGNASLVGDYEDTREPFCFYYATPEATNTEAGFTIFHAESEGNHTIGIYQTVEASSLPSVTEEDNGKILQVVGGSWAAVPIAEAVLPALPSAEGVGF